MSHYRKGFVLVMWTGPFPINASGQPTIYSTIDNARKAIERFPSWGHAAVSIRAARTRPGSNGKRDYIIGEVLS